MSVKTIEPKKTVSWLGTLRSLPLGLCEVSADYRDTNTIRVAASKLTREGFCFSVSKKNDTITRIQRIK